MLARLLPPQRRAALGLCITAPLVVSAGWLGSAHVDLVRKNLDAAEHWIAAGVVLTAGIGWGVYAWRKRRTMDRGPKA